MDHRFACRDVSGNDGCLRATVSGSDRHLTLRDSYGDGVASQSLYFLAVRKISSLEGLASHVAREDLHITCFSFIFPGCEVV
jgi:hypothetical protein